MRAPIEKFAYGDREWAAIRDLFAEIDIDAGQVNIREDEHGNYIVVPPGLARWQLDLMAPRSLRRALDFHRAPLHSSPRREGFVADSETARRAAQKSDCCMRRRASRHGL